MIRRFSAVVAALSLVTLAPAARAQVSHVIVDNLNFADPCMFSAKSSVQFSTALGTTPIVAGVAGKRIYVCSILLSASAASSVSLAEGSSATCGTSNQAGVIGVGTDKAANLGLPLGVTGGFSHGDGTGTIAQTATAGNTLCLYQSGTAQVSGNMMYVQQ